MTTPTAPPQNLPAPLTLSRGRTALRVVLENGIYLALILEIAIFALFIPPQVLFSSANILNLLRIISGVGILAVFYAVALIAGVIDFSFLGIMTLEAMVFALTFQIWQWPFWVCCLLALAVALVMAVVNGLLVTKAHVASIIATIAVSLLTIGISYFLLFAMTDEAFVRFKRQELRMLVGTQWFGAPAIIFLFVIVLVLVWVMMNHTKLGAHFYAAGGNRQAAVLAGVKPDRLVYLAFLGNAVGGWVALLFLMGRALYASMFLGAIGISAAGGTQGTLTVRPEPFVAALLAGISLFGGSGRVERILFSLLFLALLSNGMGLLNTSGAVRVTVDGLAVLFALLLDSARRASENW